MLNINPRGNILTITIDNLGPHYTDEPSSVLDIYNQIPLKRRRSLTWLFCPLDQQQIEDVWLRHHSGSILPPVLVVFYKTSFLYYYTSNYYIGEDK